MLPKEIQGRHHGGHLVYCKKVNNHSIKIWHFSKNDVLLSFNFGRFSITRPLKLFFISVGATLKGKNMLPV